MKRAIRAKALELGFDALAVASAETPLNDDFSRYEAFLDQGLHGSLAYLANHRELRRTVCSPALVEQARSVICVAQRYAIRHPNNDGIVHNIARYARGLDYHNHLRRRLKQLAAFVCTLAPGVRARAFCDTAPVLERAWAVRAGLGFLGKNGLLILPGLGSFVLLGEVVTDLEIEPDRQQAQRCGACDQCLRACPTGALLGPYVLDCRLCVASLTIEQRDAYASELETQVGAWLFGCDSCQQVCPFNRAERAYIPPGSPYDPLPQWQQATLTSLLEASPEQLSDMLRGSPLRRPGIPALLRNALVALGNAGGPQHAPIVQKLRPSLDRAWLCEVADRTLLRLTQRQR